MCKECKKLLKVDRNGTKYWRVTEQCWKCGGTGYIKQYAWYEDGVCFECKGTGYHSYEYKEMTPEYEAKLQAKRAEKLAKKHAEAKVNWFANHGFNADGITYLFLGDTYSIKEELKAMGAKFEVTLGWHIDHEVEGYHFISVNIDDVGIQEPYGYDINPYRRDELDSKKKQALAALGLQKESAHVGEIGQRLKLKVKYVNSASWGFDAPWGTSVQYIHKFVDENNNLFVWKTSTYIDAERGTELVLTGTVKEHSEYKGEKQTVLTRCKEN